MVLAAETPLHKGKYILENQLGEGFFHITYQATNTESGQTVVIKTLADNLLEHSDFDQFRRQFFEHIQRLSCCHHKHLVRVIDWFEDKERPYLVLEYVLGQTLAELVQSQLLPAKKAFKYIRQVSEALLVLHQAGELHRDIRPHNIIKRQDSDDVVICELGISCEFTIGFMQTHASLVGAGYTPLEQYDPQAQRTPATDIYALTATLYHLLIGSPPLPAAVREALQKSSRSNGFTTNGRNHPFLSHLSKGGPKLSPALKPLFSKGLALRRENRPQTVEAWLSLLPKQEIVNLPQSNLAQYLAMPNQASKRRKVNLPKVKNELSGTQLSSPQQKPISAAISNQDLESKVRVRESKKVQQNPNQQESKRKPNTPAKILTPLKFLLMTGAIATSAGIGFGFALRLHSTSTPGSTLLHTEQSFPPRRNWPVSGT
ncbi:MAG: serine/threonine-protein kinase [Coleofasciculaceae cyanobacterium]